MYLPRLYRYNKWLFAAIVSFIAMQLLVTYKRGMVITPWYNYGMYSEKMVPEKEYTVNDHLAGPKWVFLVSPQRDDKMNVTLDNYRRLPENDSLYQNEITRLFARFHLPVPPARFYHSSFQEEAFVNWYNHYRLPVHSTVTPVLPLRYHTATWNGKALITQQPLLP